MSMETVDVRGVAGEPQKKEQRGIKRKTDQSSGHVPRAAKGLKRPNRSLAFQASSDHKDGSDRLSTTSTPSALENRIHIINLIIRRNKNQHRNQPFFKCLCLLRRSLLRLNLVTSRLSDLSRTTISSKTSEQVRHTFEIEARLRSQREVLDEHIREVLAPQCYVTFSGLVADSQFGNLGVVLVAFLSELVCSPEGVGPMRAIQDDESSLNKADSEEETTKSWTPDWSRSLIVTSTRATGEDQGEIVERVYDRDVSSKERSVISGTANAEPEFARSLVVKTERGEDQNVQSRARTTTREPIEKPSNLKQLSGMEGTKISKSDPADSLRLKAKKKQRKNAIDDLFSGLL